MSIYGEILKWFLTTILIWEVGNMKIYVGVTDFDWYSTLKNADCDEVNFWKPGGKTNFRALDEGDLFLFKLRSPNNYIVGGGVFVKFSILPASLAWDAFGIANGAKSFFDLRNRVNKLRRSNNQVDPDPNIGCIILSMPFYFDEKNWIPVPLDWKPSIVQGKVYRTEDLTGQSLLKQVQDKLDRQKIGQGVVAEGMVAYGIANRYGKEQIVKPRIGQGAFKVLITDAYQRRCAITGEKTLPALEAAHIQPYSQEGPHVIENGLLLRRDLHTLLDRGYITVDKNLNVVVSHRIKEDFGNGREYYAHHGKKLIVLPDKNEQCPDPCFLAWHNENVYLG